MSRALLAVIIALLTVVATAESPTAVLAATPPGAPTAVTAVPGDSWVWVYWTAPASNGGTEITGYTVTSSPGGQTCSTTTKIACTVTGLADGVGYTFTVRASNGLGTGPASTPSSQAVPTTSHADSKTFTSYTRNIYVIKYFPVTSDGQNIDISVTGDVGDPLTVIQNRVNTIDSNLVTYLSAATRYRGYEDPTALPSLNFNIVKTSEHLYKVPELPGGLVPSSAYPVHADYSKVMTDHNICTQVDGALAVREVWLWAYNGRLDISESKMSGPYGDVSNSYRLDDMPHCQHTYIVYTFNYGRGTAEAVHSWAHQIEAETQYFDASMYAAFEGPNYPATLSKIGRCGSVHNPPNARYEYDWANPAPNPADCFYWKPSSVGATTQVGCALWGCSDLSDTDNPQLNWIVMWMQGIPGRGNELSNNGRALRNWWDAHGAWDQLNAHNEDLYIPSAVDTTPPTLLLPGAAILAAQTTGSTTKVHLSWPPAADASGIASYTLQKRVGSRRWTTVTLPSQTATSVDLPLATGRYYRFRLRATDNSANHNTSAYVTTAKARFAKAQESSTAISYVGSWPRVAVSGAAGGYVKKSTTAGNSATYSFHGTSVGWASTKGANRGIAEVWLDGVKVATIDLYASTTQTARVVWSSGTIAGGSHSVRIRLTGTKNALSTGVRVDIDAFLRWT